MEKICVAVRMRPPTTEINSNATEGTNWRWKVEDNRVFLYKSQDSPVSSAFSFAFDHVFDESCSNATVYDLLTKDIISAAVNGFNGTAFAYGQTSSGKTFTMNGSPADPGIIIRAVRDVFHMTEKIEEREFLIRVSYMEIYNEEINDLLSLQNQKLQIHESLERGIFVAGIREEIVSTSEQVFQLLELGEANRHFGETNMNARSSRSHTIFRMVIESRGNEANTLDEYHSSDAIRVSVLNLVDLAGSERVAKTGADGVRLKEGKHINKSLMALGNVINKLSDGVKQKGHIPYRDSKLTRILQPALGGNAKTSIICTIAPEEAHIEETKGTLQFASRAKRITNCAQVNEILTDAALLKRQKLEIEDLRLKLQGSRAEVLEQEILKLRNEMLQYEQEREKLELQLEEERRSQKERDRCIMEQQMKIENLSSLVSFPDTEGTIPNSSVKENGNERSTEWQEDIFENHSWNSARNAFVYKRSNLSEHPDCSPFPGTNNADDETWTRMNKGYVTEFDALRESVSCSCDHAAENVNLKEELETVTGQKHELQKKNVELLQLNGRLLEKIAQLERDITAAREKPQSMCRSVVACKDHYTHFLSSVKEFVPGAGSSIGKLISAVSGLGIEILSSLEESFSGSVHFEEAFRFNDSVIREKCEEISESLRRISESETSRSPLALKDYSAAPETNGELCDLRRQYDGVERRVAISDRLIEASRERYGSLEKELQLLRDEGDASGETVSHWTGEERKRKHLEEEMEQLNLALANRQRSFVSFYRELKAVVDKMATPKC